MKQLHSFCACLILAFLIPIITFSRANAHFQAPVNVPFIIAQNYFMRNDAGLVFNKDGTPRDYIFLESTTDLEKYFGYATSMGPKGSPTKIDFSKQFVIAIVNPTKDNVTNINVTGITQLNKQLQVTYETTVDNSASFKSKSFAIVVLDRKYAGTISVIKKSAKPTTKPLSVKLSITPIDNNGGLGQVTFSQNNKAIFYFNNNEKKGLVTLNGTKYELTNYDFFNHNGTSQKYDGYTLSGNGVLISAPNVRPKNINAGGDCLYGIIPTVTIKLNGSVLVLKNVTVQDCPNY